MSPEARSSWPGWTLLGLILLGAILFGAVADLPMPGSGVRYNIRHIFVATVLGLSALVLFASARSRRPRRTWLIAGLAFPTWIALQLIPLPRFLVQILSPGRIRLHDDLASLEYSSNTTPTAGEIEVQTHGGGGDGVVTLDIVQDSCVPTAARPSRRGRAPLPPCATTGRERERVDRREHHGGVKGAFERGENGTVGLYLSAAESTAPL